MTSPTIEGALAEIASARRDRDAEMFRAGAEAMRELCASQTYKGALIHTDMSVDDASALLAMIRSLDIPEMPR